MGIFVKIIKIPWSMISTAVYTLFVAVGIVVVAPFSKTGRATYFFARVWAWLILTSNRVRLEIVGRENAPLDTSYIFISNHSSNLDPPAIAVSIRHPLRFVGKASLLKIPIFGWALRMIRVICIDRGKSREAIESVNRAIDELQNGISAFFFAEGTRSRDGKLLPFKKGGVMLALRTGLPILPVTVVDGHLLMPKSALYIRPGTIRVIIGKPIDVSGYREVQRDELLHRLRTEITDTLLTHSKTRQPVHHPDLPN